MDLPDRSEIVRLTAILETLAVDVKELTRKVEALREGHISYLEKGLTQLQSSSEHVQERLQKIEENNRWMFRTIVGEGIALLAGLILWAISTL